MSTLVCYEGNNGERKLRKFLKSIERNINNIIEFNKSNSGEERQSKGFQISIESINGIKRIFGKGKLGSEERHYYIRYFMNMFSLKNLHFYGNTYRSPLLPILTNETGEIFFSNPEPFYAYCLSPEEINDVCIVQIIYVETTKDDDIITQSCEGWSILPIVSNLNAAESGNQHNAVYLGTPRELLYKEIKSIVAIQGASLVYSISFFPELEAIKFLIPDYIIIAEKEEVPGLLQRYIPRNPKEAKELKTVAFDDVYFKNIEIEYNPSLEDKLIAFAKQYRLDKYKVVDDQFNKIFIKERRLKCGIHNTWCFINSNGLENSITLSKKDNILYYKGVHLIDNFFSDEMASCAFIIELNYIITVPINGEQKEETLSLPVGYSVFIPDRVSMENNFRSAYFITGPGVTVYGDYLWDPLDLSDKMIKIDFILSKNKETVDRQNKDRDLEELNKQLEELKTSMVNEYNQNVLSKDRENTLQVQELEERIKMLQSQIDLANRDNHISNFQPPSEPVFEMEQPDVPTESIPVREEEAPIKTEKIQTKQKENVRYEPKVMQTSVFNKDDYSEFQQFLDYKKKAKMYKSSEQLVEDIEDVKHTNKILYEESTKDISRKEKAGLISKGILGLDLSETTQKSLIDFTFEKELTSSFLAHVITFQFLTYKPRRDVKRTNEFPNKLRFNFSFWDFENFDTPVCNIAKDPSVLSKNLPMTLIKEGSAITSRDEDKEMSVTIKYDPSANSSTDLKTFVTYLINKQMLILITDAETLLEFGYIKVPLRDLIRQGKSQTYQTKEYDIINQDFDLKGSIQMMIKSVEAKTMKPFNYDPLAFKLVNSRMGYNIPKKKKVAVKPIDLNKLTMEDRERFGSSITAQSYVQNQHMKQSVISNMGNQYQTRKLDVEIDIEKKIRVMRYLKEKGDLSPQSQLEETKLAEMSAKKYNEDKFFQTLTSIDKLKQLKKETVLSRVGVENHKNTLSMSLVQGQPHFLNYVVYNESELEELFHIVISSSYEKEIPIPQEDKTISIVSTPEEWKRIVDLKKLAKPNDFNCLSNDYYLSIKPNESVPLIIKLLSYDQKNTPTSYTLWIHKKSGYTIYYFSISIPKIFPLIDHVFQYNVPCNQFQKIKLVNPFKYNKGKTLVILNNLICTDQSVNLQAEPKSYDFLFQYSTKEEGFVHEFMLFLYLEPTRSVLYATWKFEIYCREAINVNANIGGKQTQHIQLLPVNESKTLQLFSERPETLFFPEEFNSPFVMVPSARKEGVAIIYPKKEDHKEILVNCVNVSTRELVKSWLFKLATFKPTIDQTLQITCKVGSITNMKYEFKNPMNNYRIFNFDSSNDEIMSVVDTRVQFNALETNYINLSIVSQSEVGKAEAMMFIYDNEEVYSQTVLFQINYK